MKTIKFMITVIVGICIVVSVGYWAQAISRQNTEHRTQDTELISIADFQRMLNKIEPDNLIVPDGKLGPETQAKWERVYCNQSAIKTFTTKNTKRHEEK